jgi:DNA polymerase III alpha subunit
MNSSKIKTVNKIGSMPCMDITVKSKNHIFYANGIATSNSHSVSYAKLAYATAYMKCHFPLHFFASSLYWAKEKIDEKEEIRELVYESKKFNIDICPPSLKCFRQGKFGFHIMENKIYFGLSNVKGIGQSACKSFLSSVFEIENIIGKTVDKLNWMEFLILLSGEASKTLIKNSISVGLLDHFKIHRQKMLFDYDIWSQINDHEQKIIKANYNKILNIENCIDLLLATSKSEGGPKTENRRKLLSDLRKLCDSPPFALYDNREWISKTETELMGVTLTASMLEGANTSNSDTTCKEFNNGKTGSCSIAAVVTRVNEYVIKKGKQAGHKMGAMTIQDDTDKISSVLIFADAWEANKDKIYSGAQLILHGQKSKQNDSFLVSKVRSI